MFDIFNPPIYISCSFHLFIYLSILTSKEANNYTKREKKKKKILATPLEIYWEGQKFVQFHPFTPTFTSISGAGVRWYVRSWPQAQENPVDTALTAANTRKRRQSPPLGPWDPSGTSLRSFGSVTLFSCLVFHPLFLNFFLLEQRLTVFIFISSILFSLDLPIYLPIYLFVFPSVWTIGSFTCGRSSNFLCRKHNLYISIVCISFIYFLTMTCLTLSLSQT